MRILITSGHSFEGETGSALITANLAKQLSYTNDVIYMQLGDNFSVTKINNKLTLLTIPSYTFNGVTIPFLSTTVVKNINAELDKFKPEIIHGQNIIFGSLVALIWSKRNKIPFVLTLHAPPHQDLVYVYPKLEKNKILNIADKVFTNIYNRTFVSNSSLIIALNKTIVNSLKIVSPNSRVMVVNNGIPLHMFKKLKINKPGSIINFIFTGSFLDRKNQLYLVNVFRYLPKNYILDLYGLRSSGGKYLDTLESVKRNFKLTNIHIHDYVSGKELVSAYDRSHYMMSASIREVQSLSIIESMASGKPIIALQNETTDDVVRNSQCLILPKNTNAKDFAKKVVDYVRKTDYIKISKECRNESSRFDIKLVSREIVEVYKKTINQKDTNESSNFILNLFLVMTVSMSLILRAMTRLFQFFRK